MGMNSIFGDPMTAANPRPEGYASTRSLTMEEIKGAVAPKQNSLLRRVFHLLGSATSGNFGHAGRPGEVGGSAKDGGFQTPSKAYGVSAETAIKRRVKEIVQKVDKHGVTHEVPVFEWAHPDGTLVTDEEMLKRVDAIKGTKATASGYPAAWINPDLSSSLLAVGFDAKGRAQPVYDKKFTDDNKVAKFLRVALLSKHVDAIRKRVAEDCAKGVAVAHVFRVMDRTVIRVGGTADTKGDVVVYGATTLESRHIRVHGDDVHFKYDAKGGESGNMQIKDSVIARFIESRQSGLAPTDRLWPEISSRVFNAYLKQVSPSGVKFTAKNFRDYHATRIALDTIEQHTGGRAEVTKKEFHSIRKEAARRASAVLQNTPGVALANYIDPTIWDKLVITGGKPKANMLSRYANRKIRNKWKGNMASDNYVEEMRASDAFLRQHVEDVTVVDSTDPADVQAVHGEVFSDVDDAVVDKKEDDDKPAPKDNSHLHRFFRALGSSTSGNYGHAGRPGQRGGSAKRGDTTPEPVAPVRTRQTANEAFRKGDVAEVQKYITEDLERRNARYAAVVKEISDVEAKVAQMRQDCMKIDRIHADAVFLSRQAGVYWYLSFEEVIARHSDHALRLAVKSKEELARLVVSSEEDYKKAVAAADEVSVRVRELYKERNAITEASKQEIHDTLKLHDVASVPSEFYSTTRSYGRLTPDLKKGGTWLASILDPSAIPEPVVFARTNSTRSSHSGRMVEMSYGADGGAYVHELAHHIEEHIPAVRKMCQEFLRQRTDGELPVKLKDISPNRGYKSHEVAKKDHFINPYMGKIYESGATEILSMGLEQLYRNPLTLRQKDPEYFEFMLKVLTKVRKS